MALEEKKFPTYKDHLNKTFLEELGYKIWITKGARFNANKRLLKKTNLSNKAMGFLTAYLIIFGLFSVYQISKPNIISNDIIAFSSTAISILLLAFGQMENAQDYKTRAHLYHECALKLSLLYNETRIFKTLKSPTDIEKAEFSEKISKEYQNILNLYTNHEDIDFEIFKVSQHRYYELNYSDIVMTTFKSYWETEFLYHLLIFTPIILTIILYTPK
jgi:hypothetical protein